MVDQWAEEEDYPEDCAWSEWHDEEWYGYEAYPDEWWGEDEEAEWADDGSLIVCGVRSPQNGQEAPPAEGRGLVGGSVGANGSQQCPWQC